MVKDSVDASGGLAMVADVDTWEEYAARCESSARKGLTRDDSAMQDLDQQAAKQQRNEAADPAAGAQRVAS
jgi:hypothetical protein